MAKATQQLSEIEQIRDLVNKAVKATHTKVATEHLQSDIENHFSTGWTLLDTALGGGVPVGRIMEVYGKESSGKTALAYHLTANTQRQGGVVVYLDAENTFDKSLASRFGVKLDELLLSQEVTLKSIFPFIRQTVETVRGRSRAPILVVWDTLASTPTGDEEETNAADGLHRAKIIRDGMRSMISFCTRNAVALVVLNHVSEQIQQGGGWSNGPRLVTPGGGGIKFASSARINLRSGATITEGDSKKALGTEVIATLDKNKLNAPKVKVMTHLLFGYGFDDRWSVFYFLKEAGLLQQAGAWVTLPAPEGKTVKTYPSKFLKALDENPGLWEYLRNMAAAAFAETIPGAGIAVSDVEDEGISDEEIDE